MEKMKYYILFIVGCLLLQSCLHEEDDIFGESAAKRLNDAQKRYSEILTKAPNGWILEYMAGDAEVKSSHRGAFNFLLKFENGKVTASVEQSSLDDIDPNEENPYKSITSLYKLEQDMSVTLSFDSYNSFLHYYHEQHGSYTTYKGDFEFTIMEATDDMMILRGKKYGNKMKMRKMDAGVTWEKYLEDVNKIYLKSIEYPTFSILSGGTVLTDGTITDNRQFIFSYNSVQYNENILYTPTGMKFLLPVTIANKEVENFIWDEANLRFNCTDNGATDLSIQLTMPDDYIKFAEYLGTYTFNYLNVAGTKYTRTVVVRQKVRQRSYIVDNFTYNLPGAEVEMKYDRIRGVICLGSQFLRNNPSTGYPQNLYPLLASGSFYANVGDAYGRFIGNLRNSNIYFERDREGSLSAVTVGFVGIERRGTSNYSTGVQNQFRDMSFIRQ